MLRGALDATLRPDDSQSRMLQDNGADDSTATFAILGAFCTAAGFMMLASYLYYREFKKRYDDLLTAYAGRKLQSCVLLSHSCKKKVYPAGDLETARSTSLCDRCRGHHFCEDRALFHCDICEISLCGVCHLNRRRPDAIQRMTCNYFYGYKKLPSWKANQAICTNSTDPQISSFKVEILNEEDYSEGSDEENRLEDDGDFANIKHLEEDVDLDSDNDEERKEERKEEQMEERKESVSFLTWFGSESMNEEFKRKPLGRKASSNRSLSRIASSSRSVESRYNARSNPSSKPTSRKTSHETLLRTLSRHSLDASELPTDSILVSMSNVNESVENLPDEVPIAYCTVIKGSIAQEVYS